MITPEPSKHANAKWIFGLLFFFSFLISTILLVLVKLTSKNVAVPLASYVVATQFSKNGLDDPTDVEKVKQQILALNLEVYRPFGERFDVSLTKDDLKTLSPKEIRLKVFRQIVEPIYNGSVPQEALNQYGPLASINVTTNQNLNKFFLISLLFALSFLIGFVYFSWGYGRLVNPAIHFLILGVPASLFYQLISHARPEH